jgi:hypothetical protein
MNITSRRYLSLLAILLALPAQAQVSKPAPKPEPVKPAAATARSRIDVALENLRQRVLAGETDKAVYEEFVSAVKSGFESLQQGTPDATAVRARLVAALDDIYERAKRTKIAAEEFAALRVEVLDATLLNALSKWAAQPGEDGMKAVEGSLKELADAAQEVDPGSAGWRGRAQALLEALKQNPAPTATDVAPLQEELAHARALRSEGLLEKHATARGASPTDFARVRDQVSDLLELQTPRDPGARDLKKKLMTVIDELEQRGTGATLTSADFELLRKELAQRGGTSPAEKPKPRG